MTVDWLRTSFWFVPTIMALAGVALLAVTLLVEERLRPLRSRPPWYLYVGDPSEAQTVLSTLLSSMITMASLVFSITMVVLTLAASQFGPRLIRSFMGNLQTQIVLGAFVMTIVFCLLALPALEVAETTARLPYVSVSAALALTLLSVALLVVFLDSLARSIVSETVIDRVGRDLDRLIEQLPEAPASVVNEDPTEFAPADLEERAVFFGPRAAGYVQAIEFEQLIAAAAASDVLILLYFRAGHYLVPGAPEIGVYPGERLDEDLKTRVQAAIITGVHRMPIQDTDFSIRHFDEIATRALSPGVNDPYTAVAVTDRLSASLCKLMGRALPRGVLRDDDNRVRVLCTPTSYRGLIGAAFNQLRQHGAGMPIIVLHILEAVERIGQHARFAEQREALMEEAEALMQSARRRIDSEMDLKSIEDRYAAILAGAGRGGNRRLAPGERPRSA